MSRVPVAVLKSCLLEHFSSRGQSSVLKDDVFVISTENFGIGQHDPVPGKRFPDDPVSVVLVLPRSFNHLTLLSFLQSICCDCESRDYFFSHAVLLHR